MTQAIKNHLLDEIARCEEGLTADSKQLQSVWVPVPDFMLEAMKKAQKTIDEAEVR